MHFIIAIIDILNCDNSFTCPEKCLNDNLVCDGEYDCIDNSDEMNCGKPLMLCTVYSTVCMLYIIESKCSGDQFTCITGSCISLSQRCDGNMDCTDQSDEFLCGKYLLLLIVY